MRLIACEHENRRVSIERTDAAAAIASSYEGKRLNSPNDVVVRSDGRVFFTDPPYGITEDQRELPFNGVFTIEPSGGLTLLATDFDRPNGLAFSPDERTLYIADTNRNHVRAFDVAADGTLSNGRVFVTVREDGRPDGMKVDTDGRLYVCAKTVQVFAPDGRPLGVIDCPQMPAILRLGRGRLDALHHRPHRRLQDAHRRDWHRAVPALIRRASAAADLGRPKWP